LYLDAAIPQFPLERAVQGAGDRADFAPGVHGKMARFLGKALRFGGIKSDEDGGPAEVVEHRDLRFNCQHALRFALAPGGTWTARARIGVGSETCLLPLHFCSRKITRKSFSRFST